MKIIEFIENEPRVSHTVIAENTENKAISIRKLITRFKSDFEEFGELRFEIVTVKNSVGAINEKKTYYLNEQQATLLLTYLKNSETVRKFKILLVREFFKMRELLQNKKSLNQTKVNLKDSQVREAFFIAFDGKCYYSKETLTKTHFHIDHILPKSKGGEDILCNLVLCKPEVNLIKADKYEGDFVEKHQSFVNQNFAPKIESILNLIESKNQIDLKYLFNSGVMNKLIELYGKESIKELYSNLIPNLNYKKSKKEKNLTTEYFIENHVVSKRGKKLATVDLYQKYLEFCVENQISSYNKIQFFRIFREIKRVPKINLLSVSRFAGVRKRYFNNLEVIL